MPDSVRFSGRTISRDLIAGMVVFLVALPLCLGVALASNAPLFSGILSGVIGGIVVGWLSRSHTSVSGPDAALTAIVAAQLVTLKSFDAFLLAVVICGLIQIVLGLFRAGFLSAFVPSSVIRGLLAAIGIILILKQIPHVLGHDTDPEGEMAFFQPDQQNTFSELGTLLLGQIHLGAVVIGLTSILILFVWDRWQVLKKSLIPPQLIVVVWGVVVGGLLSGQNSSWAIGAAHLVQVPVAQNFTGMIAFLQTPDFTQWLNPAVWSAGLTLAIAASLATLINIEAVDRIDPLQRESPASRELVAQGVGNLVSGLLGGLPLTSVIVRSSVNIDAGNRTKLSAIFHGVLLLVCALFLPTYLNRIPLSCLAAILLVTGFKLASPSSMVEMWREGRYQFFPYIVTLLAIVFTDLLKGLSIGLLISIAFILNSSLRRPLRRIRERHVGGEVLRIELANQVSFLNKAALEKVLREAPRGSQLLLDARQTDYIDPDILSLIRTFKETTAPVQGVTISLMGFRDKYHLEDSILYVDYTTRELQDKISSSHVLRLLREGNERFRTGNRLTRDLGRQVHATAAGQHPLAVVLSCIDSRTPTELIFDLGLGDIFSVRVAGNVISAKVLGSMEYGCAVVGAKLILVVGHTKCGAVTASVNLACSTQTAEQATGCQHLESIIHDIKLSIDLPTCQRVDQSTPAEKEAYVDDVARRNVLRAVRQIVDESTTIHSLVEAGKVAVVGAMYDVNTGHIDFMIDEAIGLPAHASLSHSTICLPAVSRV